MTTAQDQQSRAESVKQCHDAFHKHVLAPNGIYDRGIGWVAIDASGDYQVPETKARWLDFHAAWQAARALPAGMDPVTGQCRFAGDLEWRPCAVEHVRMVLAAPQEWEGYEVRCLYVAAPLPPAAQKRYRLLVRNVDTIQANDEFLRDADSTWQIDPQGIFVGMPYMSNVLLPARRAIEPTP